MRIKRSLSAIITSIFIAALPLAASAQFSVGVGFTVGSPPPPIPYYAQPPAPYPNYQWTPGYWGWGPAGYYWVPGTWVAPPSVGLYWTPGYWGGGVGGGYGWNAGYWGASVGFYGGINYGYGYPGTGFYGGTWGAGGFRYNTSVVNVNRTVIHNTYNKTIVNNGNFCNHCTNVSYNGGKGGISAKPTSAQINARQHGLAPTTSQKNQAMLAGQDRNQFASVNKGKPPVTSSQKPFSGKLPNSAPITTADKQNAQKTYKTSSNGGLSNKAPATTQNKPATSTQNKPAMQAKPQHKPAPQNQPAKQPKPQQKPPSSSMQSQNMQHHPNGHPPQGGMQSHQGSQGHPNTQGKPPSGSGGKPPGGSGGKPPQH